MKTYFPYYFRNIGIVFVIVAIGLSFYANINSFNAGFTGKPEMSSSMGVSDESKFDAVAIKEYHIISNEMGKDLTLISLFFSFSGFLLYMFSKEKIEDEFIQKIRFMSLAKSLLLTWIIASILLLVDGHIKFEGFYILQLQLIIYVVIYNYYKRCKFI